MKTLADLLAAPHSPLPWVVRQADNGFGFIMCDIAATDPHGVALCPIAEPWLHSKTRLEDAELIAAAVSAVPSLLARISELEAEVAKLRSGDTVPKDG